MLNEPSNNARPGKDIVFIDYAVAKYRSLILSALPQAELFMVESQEDGVVKITSTLQNYTDISSAHLVSFSIPGCIYLGNSELSLRTLERYAWDLQAWFPLSTYLANTPPVHLYGGNVATGDAGEELINKLKQLTGAKIIAAQTPISQAIALYQSQQHKYR